MLIGATPGIEDDGERAASGPRDDALAGASSDVGSSVPRRVVGATAVQRHCPPQRPICADRLPQHRRTVSPSSLRSPAPARRDRCGTGSGDRLPVLLVAGEHDAKFARDRPTGWPTRFPTRRWCIIEGAGHTVHLEHPDDDRRRDSSTWLGARHAAEGEAERRPARRRRAAGGRSHRARPISAGPLAPRRTARIGGAARGTASSASSAGGRQTAATTERATKAPATRPRRTTACDGVAEPDGQRALAGDGSVGMSRRLLTTSSAHASAADAATRHHASAVIRFDRDVGGADRRDEPEEHEHEHLAEPQ